MAADSQVVDLRNVLFSAQIEGQWAWSARRRRNAAPQDAGRCWRPEEESVPKPGIGRRGKLAAPLQEQSFSQMDGEELQGLRGGGEGVYL